MGAETFINVHKASGGHTMKQAFNDAVADAAYEYGHRGYTGSLAEKSSCVHCGTVDTEEEACALAVKLINDQDPRIDDKWGPAGAINFKVTGATQTMTAQFPNGKGVAFDVENAVGWVFFGWASC